MSTEAPRPRSRVAESSAAGTTEGGDSRRPRRGLTIVYTGNGKGKTTAAVGLAVRAAGNRMKVLFVQFIKGQWKSGEREVLRAIPGIDLAVTGRGFTIDRLRDPRIPLQEHQDAATSGWAFAQALIQGNAYDVVVLDEILGAVTAGLVPLDELLETVRTRPAELHLVLTGRGAPPALVELADLVSEIQPIKHPFQQGIKAQRGIEF